MSKRVRIGVVGCGFFSVNHLHAWTDLAEAGADLVAVADLDGDKARARAAEFDVPHCFDSAEAMLASGEVDLVDVVTQVATHRPVAEAALGAGIGTIVQKPFGLDIGERRRIVAAGKQSDTFLAVHENFRFQVPNRMIAEIIASGAIGEVNWGRVSFRTGYDIYAGQPYLMTDERFVLLDLGSHVLDLARFFFGEVAHLSAETQRRNPRVAGEDTATMLLRHESGTVSLVECTYETRRKPDPFPATILEIEGTKGAIRLNGDYSIDVTSGGEMITRDGDAPVLSWAERPWHIIQESVLATQAHILERFRAGRDADVSGEDNVKTFALCEAAYKAAETGRTVKPGEV